MNPYETWTELLFTCVKGPMEEVVDAMLSAFNEPSPSDVEQALMAGSKEVHVFENGIRKIYRPGDKLPPRTGGNQYHVKQVSLDFSLAYVDVAERDGTKGHRVIFWEPQIHPQTTAFIGRFADGMSHSVWSLSKDSPYTWINIRIHRGPDYPGCFFHYYADRQRVSRVVYACLDENGRSWEFKQDGPIQPFENPEYYTRQPNKDRFTREIITEYLEKLGFRIAQEGFWKAISPSYYLWQERPTSI